MIAIPTVHTIWCDDVRREVGNKFSCMGVYNGDAVFAEMPATVGKMCAVVSTTVPVADIPHRIVVAVKRSDGSVVSEVDATLTGNEQAAIPEGRTHATFFFVFEMNMLHLTPEVSYLVAHAKLDDKEYFGPKLWIVFAPTLAPSGEIREPA